MNLHSTPREPDRPGSFAGALPTGVGADRRIGADRRLRRALDIDTIGVVIFDGAGVLIDANDAFLRMSGYARSDVEQRRLRWEAMTPEEWRAVSDQAIAQLRERGSAAPYERQYVRKDGTRWWGVSAAKRVSATEIMEFIVDITTRKQAEEALRASEAQYRNLFDSIDLGFCVAEMKFDDTGRARDYRFLEVNSRFEQQTGMADARGRWMREIEPSHEQHWFDVYGHVAKTGESVRFEQRSEALSRWFDVYAFRVGEPGSNQIGILFRDVTSQVAAREALAEASREKDRFIATLSHELRNPLASIYNASHLLQAPVIEDARRRWAAHVVQRQSRVMSRLIDDLLDMSRISLGRMALQREPVSLASVIETALEATRPAVDAANHALALDRPPPSVTVDADPVRLAQVISNLVANAARYTPRGGRITVSSRVEKGMAIVEVSDNGIGMDRSAIDHVFDMYTELEPGHTPSQGGFGIGLALVHSIMKLHDGWVRAESEGRGHGSRFSIGVPLADGPHAEVGASPGQEITASGGKASPAARQRVLVVDDNQDAAQSLAMLLELSGHETRVAITGGDALAQAQSFLPQVAIVDIGLPDMSGYDVARHMRQSPWGRQVRLVAATGMGRDSDKREALESGFDLHLTKPVDAAELERFIRE